MAAHRTDTSAVDLKKLFWNPDGARQLEHQQLAKLEAKEARKGTTDPLAQRLRDQRDERNGDLLAGVRIAGDRVTYQDHSIPLAGARAAVETAGDIDRRITASRVLAVGIFALAWRKRQDRRELYLTVEGDQDVIFVGLDPKTGPQAREFAARINGQAKAAT